MRAHSGRKSEAIDSNSILVTSTRRYERVDAAYRKMRRAFEEGGKREMSKRFDSRAFRKTRYTRIRSRAIASVAAR